MAQRLIAWAGLHPPVDVEAAARRLGIDVEEARLSGSVSGLLIREAPKQWLIVVNNRCRDPRRRRFTIAHELGHWTLHRPQLDTTSENLSAEWEGEANSFAAALLMPAEHIKIAQMGYDPARYFQVSESAWKCRLRQLGHTIW